MRRIKKRAEWHFYSQQLHKNVVCKRKAASFSLEVHETFQHHRSTGQLSTRSTESARISAAAPFTTHHIVNLESPVISCLRSTSLV